MIRSKAKTIKAIAANALVEELQQYFVGQLDALVCTQQAGSSFEAVEWFRDQGLHGGGIRYVVNNDEIFNRGSVNVSQVHYEDDESKGLASATALSTIIHPKNPYAPSVHMHISWTEMKTGKGYWRMMADLNPAIENQTATNLFSQCLKIVVLTEYESASRQGDQYFYIPALQRHRGVSHFYLEEYNSDNEQVDFDLAKALGQAVIDAYIRIVLKALEENPNPDQQAYQQQQDYHTLYLFQVLTLDRGTTSGLLVHDQNDLGIMGSLPSHINKTLLATWVEKLEKPQDQLLSAILAVLPDEQPCLVDDKVKLALAKVVREHYQTNPDALAMQAQGDIVPPTVNNHLLSNEVLETLTEREAKVLREKLNINPENFQSLEEVGKQFDVTRERIRKIEEKALRKLRKRGGDDDPSVA